MLPCLNGFNIDSAANPNINCHSVVCGGTSRERGFGGRSPPLSRDLASRGDSRGTGWGYNITPNLSPVSLESRGFSVSFRYYRYDRYCPLLTVTDRYWRFLPLRPLLTVSCSYRLFYDIMARSRRFRRFKRLSKRRRAPRRIARPKRFRRSRTRRTRPGARRGGFGRKFYFTRKWLADTTTPGSISIVSQYSGGGTPIGTIAFTSYGIQLRQSVTTAAVPNYFALMALEPVAANIPDWNVTANDYVWYRMLKFAVQLKCGHVAPQTTEQVVAGAGLPGSMGVRVHSVWAPLGMTYNGTVMQNPTAVLRLWRENPTYQNRLMSASQMYSFVPCAKTDVVSEAPGTLVPSLITAGPIRSPLLRTDVSGSAVVHHGMYLMFEMVGGGVGDVLDISVECKNTVMLKAFDLFA